MVVLLIYKCIFFPNQYSLLAKPEPAYNNIMNPENLEIIDQLAETVLLIQVFMRKQSIYMMKLLQAIKPNSITSSILATLQQIQEIIVIKRT